jgi:transcriptional regulator with XRE-family HTH domain
MPNSVGRDREAGETRSARRLYALTTHLVCPGTLLSQQVRTSRNNTSPFGAELRRLRRAAGLSQQERAERAGLSVRGVADLERGVRRSPYPATVRRLVDALGPDDTARGALLAAGQSSEPAGGPFRAEPTPSLPLSLSSFVGRDRELGELRRAFASSPLLTLTGPGGIGKTRLALELARERQVAGHEVAVVELAGVSESRLVLHEVATCLRVPEQAGGSLLDLLIGALAQRQLLLVLDNCEHLIDSCAHIVRGLLAACAELRVIATSREPLGVPGEVTWTVQPLGSTDAEQLFIDRARAAAPHMQMSANQQAVVADICPSWMAFHWRSSSPRHGRE